MKKKSWLLVCSALVAVCLTGGLCACETETSSTTPTTPPSEPSGPVLPTALEVVQARNTVEEATSEGYDFTLGFGGSLSVLGISGNVDGKYEGGYRYNETTGALQFKRTTSGLLLYDSTEYVYTANDQKILLNMNEEGTVKKLSVMTNDEEGLSLVNKPFVALVDNLEAEHLTNIRESASTKYEYEANLQMTAENPYLSKILGLVGNLGTSVSFKDVTFNNPTNGIVLQFNLSDDNKLEDFKLGMEISFPVKAVSATLHLEYEQKGANSEIVIPSTVGILTGSALQSELASINNALLAVKNADAYSLDLTAENEFDPAWNITATTDSYTARMYKNTVEENVWFNHSYKYKAHHETDGAESYKYTIGNLQDNSVHLVSRKGSNTDTTLSGVSADTQFDYLVSPFIQSSANVDCIKKVTENTTTTYHIYMNKTATRSLQDTILDLINSNDAEGVVDVNNYFDANANTIRESELIVTMENGQIVDVSCATELVYCPTGGEYTEYNITLTNTLSLKINDKLTTAQEYEAPSKALATLGFGGLKDIL